MQQRDFPAVEVVKLCRDLAAHGVAIWIDGGWGVDALVGRETRPHADVDIVIEQRDVATLRAVLQQQGFADHPRDDTRPWNFVLANRDGLQVDVHVIVLDAQGNGRYGPRQNNQSYPADALTGRGTIEGYPLRCLSAGYQIDNRSGYDLRETDRHDLRVLARTRARQA